MKLRHEFVDHIPEQLDDGVLYVSISFGTVIHRCACGCGEEVVTPLGPGEWSMTYDGRTISLAPSIGNWSFRCQSHYWIEQGHVRWARGFSKDEVALVREKGRARRDGYFYRSKEVSVTENVFGRNTPRHLISEDGQQRPRSRIWRRIRVLARVWRRIGK